MVYLHSNSQFIVKKNFVECHLTRHSTNILKNYFLKGFAECQIGGTLQSRCSTRRSGGFRTYPGAFHTHARTPHTRHTHTHAHAAAVPPPDRATTPPPTRAAHVPRHAAAVEPPARPRRRPAPPPDLIVIIRSSERAILV